MEYTVYYSGAITIEADSEDEARDIFEREYFDYGDIEEVEAIED